MRLFKQTPLLTAANYVEVILLDNGWSYRRMAKLVFFEKDSSRKLQVDISHVTSEKKFIFVANMAAEKQNSVILVEK
jgi:hypothetical protein